VRFIAAVALRETTEIMGILSPPWKSGAEARAVQTLRDCHAAFSSANLISH
jgi:hypothetical protein